MRDDVYEPSMEKEILEQFRVPGGNQAMGHIFPPGVSRIHGQPVGAPALDPDAIDRLMDGAFDIHIHPGPDPYQLRIGDQVDLALEACQAGMGGVLFKSHQLPTAATAVLVQKVIRQWAREHNRRPIDVFGGVVLNYSVGGLNPAAVEVNARIGGRVVWTPTADSHHYRTLLGESGGIRILDEQDRVVAPMKEVLHLIGEGDLVLNISCLWVKEVFHLIDEAKALGVRRINFVHPNHPCSLATVDQMRIAADKGASVELTRNYGADWFSWDVFMRAYQLIGADRMIAASDAGYFARTTPVVCMRVFVTEMLLHGIPEADIEKMIKTNPKRLLYP